MSEEKEKKFCGICQIKNKHVQTAILPSCEHSFGSKCLNKYWQKKFEEKKYYWPCCPLEECQKQLEGKSLKELMGEEMYKQFFRRCENCKKTANKNVIMKMTNCSHTICNKCLKDNFNKKKCPQENCKEKWGEKITKKYESISTTCVFCLEEFQEEDLTGIKCCNSKSCNKCLKQQINIQIKETNENKSTSICLICVLCGKKLRSYIIENALGEKKYKNYMEKYKKKKYCVVCCKYVSVDSFNELNCSHDVCLKCLKNYIEAGLEKGKKMKNIECPIRKC